MEAHIIHALVPTHNPVFRFLVCAYILAKGIDHRKKCIPGLLYATRIIEFFTMALLHYDLKSVEGPSKYLL